MCVCVCKPAILSNKKWLNLLHLFHSVFYSKERYVLIRGNSEGSHFRFPLGFSDHCCLNEFLSTPTASRRDTFLVSLNHDMKQSFV